ncbi:MAG: hypothetical protein U7123_26850 [Potamolinea sp.]
MSFKSNLSYASLLLVLTGIVTPNLILSTASHVTAQSVWRPFSPPGSGFSILMPGTPKEEVKTAQMFINGKIVNIKTHTFFSEREQDGTIYMVSYSDNPADDSTLFGSTPEEKVKNSLALITSLIESGNPGIIQRKQILRLNGHLGIEMKLAVPDKKSGQAGTLWLRGFSVPRPNNQIRTYQILAISAKEQSLQRTLDGFFKSFKLIKI